MKGLKHGEGSETRYNGATYTGSYQYGQFHGYGVWSAEGETYVGK